MYFMLAVGAAGLRVATRLKLGISGDMMSDFMACAFALPWAIGQMYAEDFEKQGSVKGAAADNILEEPKKDKVDELPSVGVAQTEVDC